MKKLFTLIALFTAALLVCAACADTSAKEGTIKLTDMVGREVTLDGYADRIVALQPSDCEMLYSIGAGSALVGRGEYCNYPAEINDVPAVHSGGETNI